MKDSNKKTKILFVQDVLGKFSEAFIYRMSVGLKALDVHILAGTYENREAYPFDIDKIVFWEQASIVQKLKGKVNLKLDLAGSQSGIGFKIVDLINKSDADIVCFQFGFLPVNIGSEMSRINKPVCILHHGSDVNIACENEAYKERLKNVWNTVDKMIFVSHFLEGVATKLGCPEEKRIINYLGVPLTTKELTLEKYNEQFDFICAARLSPVKNHIRLVQAFSKVTKVLGNKVKLTLIGAGEDFKNIKDEVLRLGIEDQVHFLGSLTNDKVMPLIEKANCVVLVSQVHVEKGVSRGEEGLGISLLEGASFGLPMLGSRTGGISEMIEDGVNGFLVDYWDVDEMANAMVKLASNPEMARSMGQKSKHLVETKFNMSEQLKSFEKIFEDIAKK